MNNFSCTIWQFLMFGCTCLCGGISLGVTIGGCIWKRESDELTKESNKMIEGSESE